MCSVVRMEPRNREPTLLSDSDLEHFDRHGYVKLEEAIDAELVASIRSEIWAEYSELHGIKCGDRSTWRQPRNAPVRAKEHELNARIEDQPFVAAISDLLGDDDWKRPATWGGFIVKFPEGRRREDFDIPDDTWHWDGSPKSRGLLTFTLYGRVRPAGGGTLIASGSPRWIDAYYDAMSPEELAKPHKAHRKALPSFDPWIAALMGRAESPRDRVEHFLHKEHEVRGIPTQLVELHGEPGDTWFCNLGMLHAVVPNYDTELRFLRVKFLQLEHPGSPADATRHNV